MRAKKISSIIITTLLVLGMTLAMIPFTGKTAKADVIGTITVSASNLIAPEVGNTVVEPTFSTPSDSPCEVSSYGWTCWEPGESEAHDQFEGDPIRPGTWKIYAVAQTESDEFSSNPKLIVNGEQWDYVTPDADHPASDEYFHYAFFSKTYTVPALDITVNDSLEIPESIKGTPITEINLKDHISGGNGNYTFTPVYPHTWLKITSDGTVYGTPTVLGVNEDFFILVKDTDGKKGLAEILVHPTKVNDLTAIYSITAAANIYPGDKVAKGNILSPLTFNIIEPSGIVYPDSTKDSWQKYDQSTDTWVSQETGTAFTGGKYRYRAYMSANNLQYSFAHPDFWLKITEDNYEWWDIDYYNSAEAYGYFVSDEYVIQEEYENITITGVPCPIDGISATTYGVSVKEDGIYVDSAEWFDTDGNPLYEGDPFNGSKTYKISVTLVADATLASFAPEEDLKVMVNGIATPATITNYASDKITVECEIPYGQLSSSLYVVTAGSLNVRDSASYKSDRVGGLKYGDLVQALVESGEWVMIDFEGKECWVNRNYLALTYSEETAIYPEKYTVNVGALNVRASFDTSSERIGGLKNGDVVLVTGKLVNSQGEGWLVLDYYDSVKNEHKVGFIMAKYTASESAKEDQETKKINVSTGGVPAHVSISTKSAVAHGMDVTLENEHYSGNEDGTYTVNIYPDDAKNFNALTMDNISLPEELTGSGLSIQELMLNSDGSIDLLLGPAPADPVTVTFENNGGSGLESKVIEKGTPIEEPADPTKDGNQFDGWYADAEFTTPFDFSATIDEDTTIYAKWLQIEYTFSKGADATWTKGSADGVELTINRNLADDMTFSLFKSIELDGAVVDASNYVASSGSLNATLKPAYLETLAAGSHALKVNFSDGSAETTLTINEKADGGSSGSGTDGGSDGAAKTGDSNNLALPLGLLLASLLFLLGLIIYRRRMDQ